MGIEYWDINNYLTYLSKDNKINIKNDKITKILDFISELNYNNEKGKMMRNKFKIDITKKINDKLLYSKDELLLIMKEITNESATNFLKLIDSAVRNILKK